MFLTFAGLPVFVCFLLINVVGILAILGTSAFGMFSNSLVATLTSEPFIAVPLFLLMGEMLSRSRAIDELYKALDFILGRTRIRLYAMCTMLATMLGTMSGSAMADAAMLGRSVYPGMIERGYDPRVSTGLILAGATIAPIIPPSVLVVILATLANESIAEMLIAGLLPGLLLAALFLGYTYLLVLFKPSMAPPLDETASRTLAERLKGFARILPFGVVVFMVIGLIMLGVASPTEAAAAGVFATFLVAAYLRTLTLRMLWESLFNAAKITGTILVIIMSANLFGQLLAFTGAPEDMVRIVEGLNAAPWMIFLLLMGISLVACMFLGQTEYMLISVPIFTPIIHATGFDPVWFWMLYLINITAGGMTPPFGMTMFVFKAAVPGTSIIDIYKSTWPFVAVILFGISLMAAFPQIVLVLPQMMR
ncbi:MAG: TRAP transporter large permease [Oricola sp.]|nr:TRAP transporter large permease [Oricola sp.]